MGVMLQSLDSGVMLQSFGGVMQICNGSVVRQLHRLTAAFFVRFIVNVFVPDIEGIQNKVICL